MTHDSIFNVPQIRRIKYELPKTLSSSYSNLQLELIAHDDKRLEDFLVKTLIDERLWANGYNIAGRLIDHRDSHVILSTVREHWMQPNFDLSLMIFEGTIVGVTGVLDWDVDRLASSNLVIPVKELAPPTVRIGRTLIHPDYWGRKINQEVKLLMLDAIFAFPVGDVNCNISATNIQSIRSASNFGFQYCFPVDYYVNDELKEFHRYSLFRESWPAARELNKLKLQEYFYH